MYERFSDRALCPRCGDEAYRKVGNQMLCKKHCRFQQMRTTANRRGLSVPTYSELEQLLSLLNDMRCPHCTRQMHWTSQEDSTCVASLQHYRDGAFGIISRSCNTRHAAIPNEADFFAMKPGHKWCRLCRQAKPFADFSAGGDGTILGLRSGCRQCNNAKRRQPKKEFASV